MSTLSIEKIRKRRDQFSVMDYYKERQNQLKALVDKHGIEAVAEAGDWTVGTVKQYYRVSMPPSIDTLSLERATWVLEGK